MWRVACEDPTQNLLRLFTVADVDEEKRFDDTSMQIWKLKFGHKAKFCPDFEHKVWSRVWSWSSSKILKLKFGQYFPAEAWWGYEVDVWLRFWILEFDQHLCKNLLLGKKNWTLGSAVPLAMFINTIHFRHDQVHGVENHGKRKLWLLFILAG